MTCGPPAAPRCATTAGLRTGSRRLRGRPRRVPRRCAARASRGRERPVVRGARRRPRSRAPRCANCARFATRSSGRRGGGRDRRRLSTSIRATPSHRRIASCRNALEVRRNPARAEPQAPRLPPLPFLGDAERGAAEQASADDRAGSATAQHRHRRVVARDAADAAAAARARAAQQHARVAVSTPQCPTSASVSANGHAGRGGRCCRRAGRARPRARAACAPRGTARPSGVAPQAVLDRLGQHAVERAQRRRDALALARRQGRPRTAARACAARSRSASARPRPAARARGSIGSVSEWQ